MKTQLRKALLAAMALALSTSIFTGCSKKNDLEHIDLNTSTVSTTSTTTVTSEPIKLSDSKKLFKDESLDMRCKNWVDNPALADENTAVKGTETEYLFGHGDKVYEDSSGLQYIISGHRMVYLQDLPADGGMNIRREDGTLLYGMKVTNGIEKRTKDLNPSTDYTDYVGKLDFAQFEDDAAYSVFLNNIDLHETYTKKQHTMPISTWLAKYGFGSFVQPGGNTSDTETAQSLAAPKLKLLTGAGEFELTFKVNEEKGEWLNSWVVTYEGEGLEQVAKSTEIEIGEEGLKMSPDAIQNILGFHVIVSEKDKTVNIVTDNKDLVGNGSYTDYVVYSEEDIDDVAMYVVVDQAASYVEPSDKSPQAKSYTLDDTVKVVSETNIGYYKLEDGTFISTAVVDVSKKQTTSETESKPAPEPEPAPEWTEEPASGAYYINTDYASAREKALVGSKTVGTFSLNDQVTVVAKTNTGYYKMLNGYFVHGDYLSTTKTEATPPATSVPFVPTEPTKPNSGPKDGETKVENGKTYIWNDAFGVWMEDGVGGNTGPDYSDWDFDYGSLLN